METKFKIDEEVYILETMRVTKGTIVGIKKEENKMDDGSVAKFVEMDLSEFIGHEKQ